MADRHATIVTDLGFGDAGKGSITDFLAREGRVCAIVRFNGGGQAAHNVVTPDGRHHTFSQFGSGTFVPGLRTHLSRFMLLDPLSLFAEAAELRAVGCGNVFSRLTIDEDVTVVTPYHQMANVLREHLRGTQMHGTCGAGIGETVSHSLRFPAEVLRTKDLLDTQLLAKKAALIQERYYEEFRTVVDESEFLSAAMRQKFCFTLRDKDYSLAWARKVSHFSQHLRITRGEYLQQLSRQGTLLFEGAQGVLLDEWYGFHPHTTWSTTTFENALTLLKEIGYAEEIIKLGVLRAYSTRHGAGPFPTEDAELTQALPDLHNGDKGWQGIFRVGWFDQVLANYAIRVCGGIDALALTHLDRFDAIEEKRKIAVAYETANTERFTELPLKSEKTDLRSQEELTRILKFVTAIYEPVPSHCTSEEYIRLIGEKLKVPVTIGSYGLSAIDKRVISAHAK